MSDIWLLLIAAAGSLTCWLSSIIIRAYFNKHGSVYEVWRDGKLVKRLRAGPDRKELYDFLQQESARERGESAAQPPAPAH